MTANSTDILRTPICPALPPDFAGVRIAAAPRPLRTSPLVIHGAYRIPWADADPIAPPRHRALVLVVTSGSHCFAATPFRERILFEDDEQETPGGPLGYFTMDVLALQGREPSGDYHVLVSLGPYTSNVVRVTIV
ncbi:MAG: hypothetical protein IT372_30815 [Polyangiaceae bacterium]|nr:hypothetical protein [Polyangiaceae bacterium]